MNYHWEQGKIYWEVTQGQASYLRAIRDSNIINENVFKYKTYQFSHSKMYTIQNMHQVDI